MVYFEYLNILIALPVSSSGTPAERVTRFKWPLMFIA